MKKKTMIEIEGKLSGNFRNAYRMTNNSFYRLFNLIRNDLKKAVLNTTKTYKNQIDLDLRLSMALRIFAGGSPIDVLQSHDVSKSSVYESLWMVVDVINKCKALEFHFPTKEEQTLICKGLKKRVKQGLTML